MSKIIDLATRRAIEKTSVTLSIGRDFEYNSFVAFWPECPVFSVQGESAEDAVDIFKRSYPMFRVVGFSDEAP